MRVDEVAVHHLVATVLADVVIVVTDQDEVIWRQRSPRRQLVVAGDDDVVGKPIMERIHPDDLPVLLQEIADLRENGRLELKTSCRIRDAADPSIVHDMDVRIIDARHIAGISGIVVAANIVDTRRSFDDQVHADDFSMADAAPVGLAILASGGRLVFANQVFRQQLGLEHRNAITATPIVGFHELVTEAKETGQAEGLLTHRGLTLRTIVRKLGKPGDPGENIVISTDDITTELEAIAARATSEQTWRATFEHTPAGIALVSTDGTFLEVNPAWSAITGYPAEELIGRGFADITHPDDLEEDLHNVSLLLSGERSSYRMQKRYFHRTGQMIWVDLWVALVNGDDGNSSHFVSQILDITEAEINHEETDSRASSVS